MSEKKYVKVENDLNIWLPEKVGDVSTGEVIEVKEGDYGKQYLIKQSDDKEIWTPSHKVLQNRMRDISVGTHVKIGLMGIEPPAVKGHNPTKMYDVFYAE